MHATHDFILRTYVSFIYMLQAHKFSEKIRLCVLLKILNLVPNNIFGVSLSLQLLIDFL